MLTFLYNISELLPFIECVDFLRHFYLTSALLVCKHELLTSSFDYSVLHKENSIT